jgi:hypothetical protein
MREMIAYHYVIIKRRHASAPMPLVSKIAREAVLLNKVSCDSCATATGGASCNKSGGLHGS